MKRKYKIIISGIVAIIIGYFLYPVYLYVVYGHHVDMENNTTFLWLFKDSIKNEVANNPFGGFIKKRDVLYFYHYKNLNIGIWEFKDLIDADINKISFNENMELDNKVNSGEIINSRNVPEITIKNGFSFNYTMDINLNERSKIYKALKGNNYKGFYGVVNKMSFSNETGEHLILIDYLNRTQMNTVLIIYKSLHGFYIINIESPKQFDESVINILNLQ